MEKSSFPKRRKRKGGAALETPLPTPYLPPKSYEQKQQPRATGYNNVSKRVRSRKASLSAGSFFDRAPGIRFAKTQAPTGEASFQRRMGCGPFSLGVKLDQLDTPTNGKLNRSTNLYFFAAVNSVHGDRPSVQEPTSIVSVTTRLDSSWLIGSGASLD